MEEKKMDRRVRKTRRQLRQALTVLMKEKPVKDITVREIADMVDINRGTFYLHYRDVYDMLEQIENEIFDEFNALINAKPILEGEKQPMLALRDIFTYFAANADMAIALIGPHGDQAFLSKLKNLLRDKCLHEWMQAYHTANAETFDYFYAFAVYGCIGLFQHWLETGMREPPERMAALAEQIILSGVQVLTA